MTDATVKAVPNDMHTLTPHLVCAGAAEALDWYSRAFGAKELNRLPDKDGKLMHACMRIGNSELFLVDENLAMGLKGPKSLHGTPVTIHMQVEKADDVVMQAKQAGAKVTMPVSEMFWGDRYGVIEDPFGHSWSIASHVRDVKPADIGFQTSDK